MSNLIKLKQIDGGVSLQNKVDKLSSENHLYFKGSVANFAALELVDGAAEGQVYIVEDSGKKYVYHDSAWILLSDVVDLTPYYTKTEVDGLLKAISDSSDGISDALDAYKESNDKAVKEIQDDVSENAEAITKVSEDLSDYKTSNDEALAKKADADSVYTKNEIDSKISSVFDYKGVKATEDEVKAVVDPKVGDVYFVSADSSEYVWNGTVWEKLGPVIDLSGFATTEAVNTGLSDTLSSAKSYADDKVSALSETLTGSISDVSDSLSGTQTDVEELQAAVEELNTVGTTASCKLTVVDGVLTPGTVVGANFTDGLKAAVDSVRVVVNGIEYTEASGAFTVASDREIKAGVVTWVSADFSLDASDFIEMIFVTAK